MTEIVCVSVALGDATATFGADGAGNATTTTGGASGMSDGALEVAGAPGAVCDTIVLDDEPSDDDAPAMPDAAVRPIAIARGATKHARMTRAFMLAARIVGAEAGG